MSLHRDLPPAFRAVTPAVALLAFALVLIQTAVAAVPAAARWTMPTVPVPLEHQLVLGLTATVVGLGTILVLPPTRTLTAALYAAVETRPESVGAAFRTGWRALAGSWSAVFVANLAAVAVSAAVATGAALAWTVLGTVLRYRAYATGVPDAPRVGQFGLELLLVFAGVFLAALLVTGFADVLTLDGHDPRTAWRTSAAAVRRHPVSFLGYAVVSVVLVATPWVLGLLTLGILSIPRLLRATAAFVVFATVCQAIWAAIHATYARGTLSAADAAPAGPVPWRRVTVAAVVLLAATAGAGYVRVVDAGVQQEPLEPLPADDDRAFAVAVENTADANHLIVTARRNVTDDGDRRRVARRAVDYDDRRASVAYYETDRYPGFRGVLMEGGVAVTNPLWDADETPLAWRAGNWSVVPVPGYGSEMHDHELPVIEHVDPELVAANETTLVYRAEGADVERDELEQFYPGMEGGMTDDSTIEIVVDRERGVVDRVTMRLESRHTGYVYAHVQDYREVGTADVERPAAIGSRHPVEWVWDAMYY